MSQKSTYKCTFLLHVHVKLKLPNDNDVAMVTQMSLSVRLAVAEKIDTM